MTEELSNTFSKVFLWLGIGLLITFGVGYYLSINEPLMMQVLSVGILPIIIIELVISILMGFRIQKMNPITAKVCYLIFCVTTGITFSSIFVSFKMSSIISVFAITAIIFGLLAFYGFVTKKDLTKIGTIIFIALIGLIIGELLNFLIFKSPTTELALCGIGVLIFVLYIAYDTNNVKRILPTLGLEKAAIFGAFQLYLDFINLFIRLLQLFGKRDD